MIIHDLYNLDVLEVEKLGTYAWQTRKKAEFGGPKIYLIECFYSILD